MMIPKLPALAALFTLCALPAPAHEFTLGAITVAHPVAFATPPNAQTGGGYMEITNRGESTDRLIEVRANFPKVMLHGSAMQDGVARMLHLETLDLPPGETVSFVPGGRHVMFMGLNGDPFEVGEAIDAVLVFERAGELAIVFEVEPRAAAAHDASH